MDNCGECAELLQDGCEEIIGVCPESPVVRDYNAFTNKPSINGVTLVGNKTSEDLGITQQITEAVQTEAEARQTADEALQQEIDDEETTRANADTALDGRIRANATAINNETLTRQNVDNGLQTQIDAITSKSDVVDVVANYAALQAYDTSTLGNNDVVKVLDDETHEDALTYYRWSTTTQTWTYIGQEAPYYSKGQMDAKLAEKQDNLTAGANIQIENDTISATDTTYTAGNGLNLNGTEFSADTNVLATKEDLEDYYTKPEADNLLAPKLEAELVAELPATGAEGKLYLTPKAHTTQTATGNPITATVAEDAGAIESFQLDGDTFQQTYTGKNLYNKVGDYVQGFIGDTGNIVNSGQSVTLLTYMAVEPSTKYCISWTNVIDGSFVRRVAYYDSTKTFIERSSGTLTNDTNFTTPANCAFIRFFLYNADGMTAALAPDTYIKDIQLEQGITVTPYEPYVGGQASPNPDYPQPIQTVTGLQTVTVSWKNKYPFNDITWSTTQTSSQWSFQNGSTNAYGATITDKTAYKFVLPAGTYTMTAFDIASNIIDIQACTNGESSETIVTSPSNINSGNPSSTITLAETTTLCVRYHTTNPSLGIGNTRIQIEAGATSTPYAPFESTDYQIDLSENELEIPDGTLTNNGVECIMGNNSATITRTSTSASTSFIRYQLDTPITIHSGETFTLYAGNIDTIGGKTDTGEYMAVRLRKSGNTDDTNTDTILGNINAKTTITATEDVTYTHFVIRTSPSLYPDNLVITPRLVIGQDNSIELCKLDTYQDYIYKDGESWKVHKATGKYVYNNDLGENGISSSYVSMLTPVLPVVRNLAHDSGICRSNMYIPADQNGTGLSGTTGTNRIRIYTAISIADSYDAVRQLASDGNLTIYYPLATPTDTAITDQTLIAQLEAIRTASLGNGANTITNTATGSNLAGDMEIGYYGYNPTNRYDKWLWLDINNEYEQIGS